MIGPGDFVLLYNSARMSYLIQVPDRPRPSASVVRRDLGHFSTHRGNIQYRDVLGREYGERVRTHMGVSFFLLRPTLADLELRVRRSTTIVYPKDAGLLLLQSFVFPGARVIEVGSGSGALTIVLANFVRPDGKVYSYERRPEFSAVASENIERYGLSAWCEFVVCDPVLSGFAQSDVDAVLLDVPEPWALVCATRKALKPGNVVAAVVPTAEQVRRTISSLEMNGFTRMRVTELLERGWFVRPTGMRPADRMVAHTVFVVLAHKTLESGMVEDRTDTFDRNCDVRAD